MILKSEIMRLTELHVVASNICFTYLTILTYILTTTTYFFAQLSMKYWIEKLIQSCWWPTNEIFEQWYFWNWCFLNVEVFQWEHCMTSYRCYNLNYEIPNSFLNKHQISYLYCDVYEIYIIYFRFLYSNVW